MPLNAVSQPYWGVGKSTTALDLAHLFRAVWLSSGGLGPLMRSGSGVTPAESRYLLYVLARVGDRGKLARIVARRPGVIVMHKAGWIDAADKFGIVATIVFVAISSLIVFNTIRMAIFNRREEIQMMKLIGADRSFIRGPFIVEAVVYGFIAAIIATGLGILALLSVKSKLLNYGVAIQPTIDFLIVYIGFVLLGMIALGALIGILSSLHS